MRTIDYYVLASLTAVYIWPNLCYLGIVVASSSSTQVKQLCSRAGSFRSSTDQGVLPSLSADMLMKLRLGRRCVAADLFALIGEAGPPEAETAVCEAAE